MNPNQPYPSQSPNPTPQPGNDPYPPAPGNQIYAPQNAPTSLPPQQSYQPPQNTWVNPGQTPQAPAYPQVAKPHDLSNTPHQSYTPPPRPKTYGKPPLPVRIVEWLKRRWYVPLACLFVLIIIANIVWQVLYPLNALPPNLRVDGQNVGGMERDKAVSELNKAYSKLKVELYFGDSSVPYKTPTMSQLGIQVDNTERLAQASYPFALRFVPTSYFWVANVAKVDEGPKYNYDAPTLDTYALGNLGEDCTIPVTNATLRLDDNQFAVVPAEPGGRCNMTEFKNAINNVTYADGLVVKTDMREIDAPLTDEIAQQVADDLNNSLRKDMPLQAGGETKSVKSSVVKGWLSFRAHVPEPEEDGAPAPPAQLLYTIEPDRVSRYLKTSGIAAKVEKKPGVTRVSTQNFTETSRTNGNPGVLIDIKKTIASIDPFITGRNSKATVSVGPVPPTVRYTRSYTPTDEGYRALVEQFAQDNLGDVAVALTEITGKKPRFSVAANATKSLPAAGVEGMYVAYAVQKGIEDGSIQPSDSVFGGMSYTDCVEAAIVTQDAECIAALVRGIGNATVQARMAAIGLTGTSFSGNVNTTTVQDMTTFMRKLHQSELPIKQKGQLITKLTDISLREGMLTGPSNMRLAGGDQTDKNYNEMAIVTERGVYIASIMTQNSEGAKTAAKFIKAVESIRQQKQNSR